MAKPLPAELTENQLYTILRAMRPLPIADQDRFYDDVVDALAGLEIGDGVVARICREVQRKYWDPPDTRLTIGPTPHR